MSTSNGLVPTVITNKKGVLTTVYRRPGKTTPPSRARVPAANDADREFYLLRKLIAQRLNQPEMKYHENLWRKRVFTMATETNDLAMLQRLNKHFDVNGYVFESAVAAIDAAGLERSDDALFEHIIRFTDFVIHSRPKTARIAEFIPVLLAHPEKTEVIAHHINLLYRRDEKISPEIVTALINDTSRKETVVPEFIAKNMATSTTPVTDRRLVSDTLTTQEQWYAYHHFSDCDDTAVTYIANAIRHGVLTPALGRKVITSNMKPRSAVEFVALLYGNKDLIGPHRDEFEAALRGPNSAYIGRAMDRLRAVRWGFKENWDLPLPVDTPEGLQSQSALMRFALTVNDGAAQNLQKRAEGTGSSYDHDLVDLISRHSSEIEVRMLVDLFNERGVLDVATAEAYLEAQASPAVSSGWL
jgi:hypothetical protein